MILDNIFAGNEKTFGHFLISCEIYTLPGPGSPSSEHCALHVAFNLQHGLSLQFHRVTDGQL